MIKTPMFCDISPFLYLSLLQWSTGMWVMVESSVPGFHCCPYTFGNLQSDSQSVAKIMHDCLVDAVDANCQLTSPIQKSTVSSLLRALFDDDGDDKFYISVHTPQHELRLGAPQCKSNKISVESFSLEGGHRNLGPRKC